MFRNYGMALFLLRCVNVSNHELLSLLRATVKLFMHLYRLFAGLQCNLFNSVEELIFYKLTF